MIDWHRARSACDTHRSWLASFGLLGVAGALAFGFASIGQSDEKPALERPSILLVVLDTVRVDALSCYGKVAGTTPAIDQVASEGVRFTRAFAPAPWTLPSHATLFTGRGVEEHRVAMPGHPVLPEDFVTLAERLSEVGYETAAFSENAIVSDLFEILRGFETRVATTLRPDDDDGTIHQKPIDARAEFQSWIRARESKRPFFAFVNILDAHRPFEIRAKNPWVPASATPHEIQNRHPAPERLLCGALPTAEQVAIQRGLYLGDVHAADQKFRAILNAARSAVGDGRLITIVTSDHGELFGEHGLMGHEFSLHSGLLHVPLIVHGVEGSSPRVIETPVGLVDVMPSLLDWVAVSPPANLSGVNLPLEAAPESKPSRTFFAAYSDRFIGVPPSLEGRVQPKDKNRLRQFCAESNRVLGGMAALTRYPFKFVWYENYPASLYDLSWDSGERSDQSGYQKDLASSLASKLEPLRVASGVAGEADGSELEISKEAMEALKQLGYAE